MTNTYTIAEENREMIMKKITRLQKKAEKIGGKVIATYGESYAKEIPVIWKNDDFSNSKRMEMREVFDLTIESEKIQINGYQVVASLEHFEEGNIVSTFNTETKEEWTKIKPFCKHCNSNHNLKKTFIVRNENGEEKQVGRTCLKDFCGIDPQDIGIWNELNEIVLDADIDHYELEHSTFNTVYNTEEVLAMAIDIVASQGYVKADQIGSNKMTLLRAMENKEKPSEKGLEKARKIVETIGVMDSNEIFKADLSTTKVLLNKKYCKQTHFGFLAYAPIQFDKYMERKAKEEQRKENDSVSEYVG